MSVAVRLVQLEKKLIAQRNIRYHLSATPDPD